MTVGAAMSKIHRSNRLETQAKFDTAVLNQNSLFKKTHFLLKAFQLIG